MNCKDLRFDIEPYLAGELPPGDHEAVENHLESCTRCRQTMENMKEKISWIRASRGGTAKMPAGLENRLARQLSASAPRKRKKPWRYALAASLALAFILTSFYGGTIARFAEDIPFIQKFFSFGDRGIERSLELGVGQVIEETQIQDGIAVTVHRVISDRNRTVFLYSVDADMAAHGVALEKGVITQQGQRAKGSGVRKFHEDLHKVTGRYNTSGIEELGTRTELFFENIRFWKNHTQNISFSLIEDPGFTIPLVAGDQKVGEYSLQSARLHQNQLELQVTWTMWDPSYSNPYIKDLYQGETRLMDGQFLAGPDYATLNYHLDSQDLSEFSFTLAFQETVAATSGPVTFSINIDKDLAEKETFEREIMERVQLEEDLWLRVERLIGTASQTAIEYTLETEGASIREFVDIQLSLYSSGEKIRFQQEIREIFEGRFALSFDPTIPLNQLTLVVEGYGKKVFDPLELSLGRDDAGKTLPVKGLPLTIEKIQVHDALEGSPHGGKHVGITFSHPSVFFHNARITDSSGTREALITNVQQSPEKETFTSLVTFHSTDKEWRLEINPYTLYVEKNLEIPL